MHWYCPAVQGYDTKANIVLQDNTSAIKLEKNGQKSMGQRSRHINIRYFFVTDQIEKGNVEIEYCPTDKMVGDYLSKPLQGSKFRKFRTSILNLKGKDPKPQSGLKNSVMKSNIGKSNRVKDSKTRLTKRVTFR